MVKKVFALASVTALSGLMISMAAAGCSSTTNVEVGGDASDAAVKDANRADTNEPTEEAGAATCPITDTVDTSDLPYKSPNPAVTGACADADLIAMEQAVKAGTVTTLDQLSTVAGVSANCKSCAFGSGSAAMWAAIVSDVTIGTETTTVLNTGACMTLVSGSDACGKAYSEWDTCLSFACQDCAGGPTQACNTAAQSGACKAQTETLGTACTTAKVNNYLKACNDLGDVCKTCGGTGGGVQYSFELPIVALCVASPAADGG
ncbi:MAG: hypothetical protein JWP97_3590 [Labilithrix sp.]|nr:hypothetical protein [Labilithrix sp.]